MPDRVPELPPTQYRFASTCWTDVLQFARGGSPQDLAVLCRHYWYPLYAYLRRSGSNTQDAEDTIQAFFAWMIESNAIKQVDPQRGRFRTFLLVLLRQFQARKHQYETAAKRMPPNALISFDQATGESLYQVQLSHSETPEALFEQAWALSLIENAMQALEEEMAAAGKSKQFDCLRGMLTGQRDVSGREAAEQLGISEGAVRIAVHRMRKRYGELLRQRVAMTVHHEQDIDTELRELITKVRV